MALFQERNTATQAFNTTNDGFISGQTYDNQQYAREHLVQDVHLCLCAKMSLMLVPLRQHHNGKPLWNQIFTFTGEYVSALCAC